MGPVELILSLSIPGWVILLVVVAAYELWRQRRGKRQGTPLSATFIDEFTATFYGTKRMELEHRASMSMMREEDAEGAPPFGVDHGRGIVTLPGVSARGGSRGDPG